MRLILSKKEAYLATRRKGDKWALRERLAYSTGRTIEVSRLGLFLLHSGPITLTPSQAHRFGQWLIDRADDIEGAN